MPRVKIHPLFDYLLRMADAAPEAFVGFSLASPPELGEFLPDLDPRMPLDWNGRSFQGLPDLREAVIRQAGLTGTCSPGDVLITAGAAEANYLAMRQLLEPGDEVVTEAPGWPQAGVLAEAAGARLVTVKRREEDGWALDIDAVSRAVTDRTKMIFLTNPNNPTGRLFTPADLARLAGIAGRTGAWLLVDEVYAGLEWTAGRAPSIAGLCDRGITTGSVSKALGLQGLRTGWMICRDRGLIRDAMILRENGSEIMNILGEVIAGIALRPGRLAAAMGRARAEGRANLDALDAFIRVTPGLSWVRPEAGLIGLARLPEGVDADRLAQTLLAAPYRTFVLPGSVYGEPRHIRVGVGGGEAARLPEGLARLARCLADMGAR